MFSRKCQITSGSYIFSRKVNQSYKRGIKGGERLSKTIGTLVALMELSCHDIWWYIPQSNYITNSEYYFHFYVRVVTYYLLLCDLKCVKFLNQFWLNLVLLSCVLEN